MRSIFLIIIVCMTLAFSSMGQKNYTSEVGVVSDNDAYLFLSLDQYYTNGLMIYYRFVPKRYGEKLQNKVIEFRAGQQIYNPFQAYVPWLARMDKPFAGYLFLESGISWFYHNESMFRTDLQVGILGPSSHAEEVQNFIHKVFHLYETEGWQYQIHDTYALTLEMTYLRHLISFFDRRWDFSIFSGFRAGTIHDDLSAGFTTRASIYRLNPISNSSFTGSTISRTNEPSDRELFLYFSPKLSYVFYDATIQGGLFHDFSPVTFDVRPLRFQLEAGLNGSYKNLSAGYAFIFQTRDAKNKLVTNHVYASIFLAYRFK